MADIRKDQERDELHRAIWAIADGLRGMNIPPRGNRESGRTETAVPVKWKPVISSPIM